MSGVAVADRLDPVKVLVMTESGEPVRFVWSEPDDGAPTICNQCGRYVDALVIERYANGDLADFDLLRCVYCWRMELDAPDYPDAIYVRAG